MTQLNHKTALLYLIGVFVLGAVAGGAIGYSQAQPRPRFGGGPPKSEDYVHGKCERLTQQLNLSAEQRLLIEPIIRERAERMRSLSEESRQRIMDAMKESDRKLSDVFNAEQKAKYAEIVAQKMKNGPGGGMGPGPRMGPGGPPNSDHHFRGPGPGQPPGAPPDLQPGSPPQPPASPGKL